MFLFRGTSVQGSVLFQSSWKDEKHNRSTWSGHYRAAGKVLGQFEGQLATRLWIAPPTKMDEARGWAGGGLLLVDVWCWGLSCCCFIITHHNLSQLIIDLIFFLVNQKSTQLHVLGEAALTSAVQEQLTKEGYYAIYGKAGARTEMPGCSLCMGNQAGPALLLKAQHLAPKPKSFCDATHDIFRWVELWIAIWE